MFQIAKSIEMRDGWLTTEPLWFLKNVLQNYNATVLEYNTKFFIDNEKICGTGYYNKKDFS